MKLKKLMATTLAAALIIATPINALASTSSKVTSEFGTLRGTTTISLNGYEKRVNISMSTTKKAKTYIIKYDVRIAGTGTDITTDVELVNPNVSGSTARGTTSECVYLSATY